MADPRKPRESAPAAQDDLLGEAARNEGTMEGLDPRVGADGTPRDRADTTGGGPAARPEPAQSGDAQPGRDENQAGFVKDPDKRSSP